MRAHALLAACAVLAASGANAAGSLEATVLDKKGKPVAEAIVVAIPAKPVPRKKSPAAVDVDQVEKEFVPRVSAVVVGTPIRFPNYDQIRHHVYSFSPAKNFEIPLYKGMPATPIVFDQPGVVTLGCNIHDWMQGHVLVTETPWFATTDEAGRARLEGLPPGGYEARAWHPTMKGDISATAQAFQLTEGAMSAVRFEIDRKRLWRARRGGGRGGDRYR